MDHAARRDLPPTADRKLKPRSDLGTVTGQLEFCALLPDRVRVNTTRSKDGQPQQTVKIVRESERLKRTPEGALEVEPLEPGPRGQPEKSLPTEFRRHFDTGLIRQFFASLVLEDAGACQIAGRHCERIQATPVPGDSIWPHWLPVEADAFEFAIDRQPPSLSQIRFLPTCSRSMRFAAQG